MKKFISGLMLVFAALSLVSCVEMSSQTKLEFTKLPEAVLEEGESLDTEAILIKIDGQEVTLAAAERMGAVVEGAEEKEAGYHTLLVTYKDVTIAFTYLINEKLPEAVDTSWYYQEDGETPKVQDTFVLMDAADLRGLAQLVNTGKAFADPTFAEKEVKLGADIDLAGYPWTPIGEGSRKENNNYTQRTERTFKGTFDGDIYTISNLSDAGFVPSQLFSYTNSKGDLVNGYVYGLFGMINASDVKIRNVKLENVKINGVTTVNGVPYYADAVAGIVGWSGAGSFTIENCEVSGSIKGFDSVGGIVGRLMYAHTYNFKNCINRADLVATRADDGGKSAGIIAYFATKVNVVIENCTNTGNVSDQFAYFADELYVRGSDTTVKVDTDEYKDVSDKYSSRVFGWASEDKYKE